MNHSTRPQILLTILGLFLLSACASQPEGPEVSSRALQDASRAADTWLQERDYQGAIRGLEAARGQYRGESTQRALTTAICLIHLEYGNRSEFLESAEELEAMVDSGTWLDPQAQHVLTVSFAMLGRGRSELPGRGYDSMMVRSVYEMLGANE